MRETFWLAVEVLFGFGFIIAAGLYASAGNWPAATFFAVCVGVIKLTNIADALYDEEGRS